jgi:hypothetical protein
MGFRISVVLPLVIAVACADGTECGPGTHSEGDLCVADSDGDADTDADADADSDTDSDTDTDADTDTDTDADSDTDTDADTDTDTDADSDTDTDTDTGMDGDKDGFGTGLDCDDTDPAVNPDASEVCGNGQDDDCDGTSDGCDWAGAAHLEGIEISSDETGAGAGHEVEVCDANGDGQQDVVISAFGAAVSGGSSGAVYVFYGPVTMDHDVADADYTLGGSGPNQYAGAALACGGDVDGDGADDLIVTEIEGLTEVPGSVYLVPGGGMGAANVDDEAIGHWTGEYESDMLGADAAVLDIDGDGTADFASAAEHGTTDEVTANGATYLWKGPVTGTDTADVASVRIYGESTDGLYAHLASAGDLDGDGADELVVQGRSGESSSAHGVFLFKGPLSGGMSKSDADAEIDDGLQQGFGAWSEGVAHADLDGDGTDDLLVSNILDDFYTGAVYAWFGDIASDTSTALADAKIYGRGEDELTGSAVGAVGDVDGDGGTDLVIGASYASTGGKHPGTVYLMYGPFAGTMDVGTDAQAEWSSYATNAAAGSDIGVGDVTGDGVTDFVVAAPGDGAAEGSIVILSAWDP